MADPQAQAAQEAAATPGVGLRFYRWVTILLMSTTALLSLALMSQQDAEAPPGAAPPPPAFAATAAVPTPAVPRPPSSAPPSSATDDQRLKMVDVPARLAALERDKAEQADASETYFAMPQGTVHMHLLGKQQSCPLHLHRRAHEVTVVLSGAPEFTQVYGVSGKRHRQSGRLEPGTLVYSPPFCGHRWVNRDPERMQANLVFSAPPFEGNFYVDEDDPRLLSGAEPARYTPGELLAKLAPDEASQLLLLPIMQGQLAALLVRGEAALPAAQSERVIFVAAGRVAVLSHRGIELSAQQLIVLPKHSTFTVRAQAPSVLYVFTPGASQQ